MGCENCFFCDILKDGSRILFVTRHFFIILDDLSVNRGHMLIVSKKHELDIFSLGASEWFNLFIAILETEKYFDREFKPDGYNISTNCGEAVLLIPHLYIRIIPIFKSEVN